MKKLVCLIGLICLFCSERVFSQVIKIENGVSFSKMNLPGNVFHDNLSMYSMNVGCDYLERKWYFLSSEIGYVRKGGAENAVYIDDPSDLRAIHLKNTLDYITINASFNVKYNFRGFNLYAGIAPTLDFLVKNRFKSDAPEENQNEEIFPAHKIVLGFKPSIGIFYDTDKIRLNIETSYMKNITKLSRSNSMKANTFLLSFGIGYKL